MNTNLIENLTINEADYYLPSNEKGKLAVFIYSGGGDPRKLIDYAIHNYVENNSYSYIN